MAMTLRPILVVFLLFSGLHYSVSIDNCPKSCTCGPDSRLNCSSAGLSSAPLHIHTAVTELDLSNNLLGSLTLHSKYYSLEKVWLGNNSITSLSLCVDTEVRIQPKSRLRQRLGPLRRYGCMLWAPSLQLLSAERNQLQKLPEGLGQQRILQTVNLSFNQISKLEQTDFSHLKQLKELYLQHNLITSLHPQIFDKLEALKVLDLSFNLLTTLHHVTYISLRDIGADVGLRGNSWTCDCNMRFLQRWMAFDSSIGLKIWSIVCASPPGHSGTDLLQIDQDDLQCQDLDNTPQLHRDVTINRGSELLLSCSETDATWWIPNDHASRSQQQGNLLITDITEQDEGLYVCVSKTQQKILSIYNVQVRERTQIRKSRSLSNQQRQDGLTKIAQTRNTVSQSHFAMAVSLSVIITFIIAFILGVLVQPCICTLWQKIRNRKKSAKTNSAGPQEQYDNEAYLHCEDVDEFEPHQERRVTFSEYTEEGTMQYYDTVAADTQGSNGALIAAGRGGDSSQANKDSSDDSGSEDNDNRTKKVTNIRTTVEFEHIPDSLEKVERNSLSSHSSQSSIGDKVLKENCSTPNTSQTIEERAQHKAVTTTEVPQISMECTNEIPGFTSEPFADWTPHRNGSSIMDPDLENGEQFDFSDSVRSGSPLSPSSPNGSFRPNLHVPNTNKKIHFASSSSSSDVSYNEPTHYTVNPDSEEETEVFQKDVTASITTDIRQNIIKTSSSSSDSESESKHTAGSWPVVDLQNIPIVKKRLYFKTIFVDSYSKEIKDYEIKGAEQSLTAIVQKPPQAKKRQAPPRPPQPRKCSSSSDSKDEIQTFNKEKLPQVTKGDWPVIDLNGVGKVKRHIHFKVKTAYIDTSSSSDSEDEREIKVSEQYRGNLEPTPSYKGSSTVHFDQESQWPIVDLEGAGKVNRRLDFKVPNAKSDTSSSGDSEDEDSHPPKPVSDMSSSSESEDEREIKVKQYQDNIQLFPSPNQQASTKLGQDSQWPVIDLVKLPKLKRRLDIKTSLTAGDSPSSSDSEDERVQVKVTQVPPTVVTVLKPSASIKTPKPDSGTSSSSESENEKEIKVKQHHGNLQQMKYLISPSTSVKIEHDSQWPVVDLARIHKVKRRLDVQSNRAVESSSSSESEDEKVNVKVTQVQGKAPSVIVKVPRPISYTSSSSESEDERVITEIKQHQATSLKKPQTPPHDQDSQWPVIDLAKIPKLKRRLDIKDRVKLTQMQEKLPMAGIIIPKPDSGTSSSSESENEKEFKEVEHYYEDIQKVTPSNKQPTTYPESQWPQINLMKVPKPKRRLDIKTSVPALDSSSSSDSEKVNDKVTQVQGKVPPVIVKVPKPKSDTSSSSESEDESLHGNLQQTKYPISPSTSVKIEHDSQWPVVDLARIHKVKRRLDVQTNLAVESSSSSDSEDEKVNVIVKVPKPKSYTSSSSESEDERVITEIKQHQATSLKKPQTPPHDQESQWPVINLAKIPKLKRRLDIKDRVKLTQMQEKLPIAGIIIPKPYSGTSSSSDSENEKEFKEVEHYYEDIHHVTAPNKRPATTIDPEPQWPVINLVKIQKLKRRLDIRPKLPDPLIFHSKDEQVKVPSVIVKGPEQKLDTSSSSDSEDEREIKVIQQQTTYPIKPTISVKPGPDSQWPVVDLVKIPKVKRRLDVKTTLAVESSSSESEDEKVNVKVTQVQGKVPSTSIAVPKLETGTSYSSDSEDEQEIKKVENYYENIPQVTSPNKYPTTDPEPHWPKINLQVPKLRRRLDVKTTLPALDLSGVSEKVNMEVTQLQDRVPSKLDSGSSSSSESEDEREIKEVKQHQENLLLVTSLKKQPTEPQWPMIDLTRVPNLKRRLDFRPVPAADLSSKHDREGEKVIVKETQVQERVPSVTVRVPKPESGSSSSSESEVESPRYTEKHDLKTQWPVLDLEYTRKLKRRLDIKVKSSSSSKDKKVYVNMTQDEKVPSTSVHKPGSGTSSSSDSEDERETKEVKQENIGLVTSPNKHPSVSQWPVINVVNLPKLKRRLDIRPTVHSSSSSEDEKGNITVTQVQDRVPPMSIKVPITESGTSSSSESEDETTQKVGVTGLGSQVGSTKPQTQWPVVELGGMTRIKRRLDFKTPYLSPPEFPPSGGSGHTFVKDESTSSSSSDEEDRVGTLESPRVSVGQTSTRWTSHTGPAIPLVSRRLDVKGPSLTPGSQYSESSSSSDDEKAKHNLQTEPVKSQDNRHFIKVSPKFSIPQSPTKNTHKIELEKYTVVTDDFKGKSFQGNSTTPDVTPEMQSKWAMMNLGHSRFRKRLDIMARTSDPPPLPLSPPPGSPKQENLITSYTKSINVTEQELDSSSSSENESEQVKKYPTVEIDSALSQARLANIPQVKRSLKVTTMKKKSSSSSSEDEAADLMVPDLSAGVPRLKRRLKIKAPTPPPSSASSSSEDEKRYAHKFFDVTDQRSIEYKRTIMKTSSLDSYSSSAVSSYAYREPQIVESHSQTPKKGLNFDNLKRKFLPSKQIELPPNLRWSSVGSSLSEHPIPTPKRHYDGHMSPKPLSSPPPAPKKESSDSSSSESEAQDVKTTLVVTQKYSSHSSVNFDRSYESPTSVMMSPAASQERNERRGLSALKAMSSSRKNWDSEYETFTETTPVSVDYDPQLQSVYQRTAEVRTVPKMSQPQTYSTSSPASDERRLADMLYGIPSYKRHVIKATELPQGPPPPVPTSPLPDDGTVPTWRSPQSSIKPVRESLSFYVQKKTEEESSADDPFYDNPNISAV